MGTVDVFKKARSAAIEALAIVGGTVNNSGRLILSKYNGDTIDAGSVIGPQGPKGDIMLPPGFVLPFAGSSAPSGFLIADGSNVSRTTYSALYAIIGTTYGAGDGSSTFALPDLRGRVPVGVGTASGATGASAHTLAQVAGEETHKLSISEMPSHTHPGSPMTDNVTLTWSSPKTGTGSGGIWSNVSGGGANQFSVASQGNDTAHNNMQPYVGLNYAIKT